MNPWQRTFLSSFLAALLIASVTAKAQSSTCSAFVDVTVVPMNREQVLPHQTVLIRNDRIGEIVSARDARLSHDCDAIDGRHRYLIPGLVDSHVHLPLIGTEDQFLVLQLLLANGITAGINMEGSPEIVALRNRIRAGTVGAPAIYTTGIFIQQPAFMTADQVRNEVVSEKSTGYDFIKVHGELTKEAYDALFETARAQSIRVGDLLKLVRSAIYIALASQLQRSKKTKSFPPARHVPAYRSVKTPLPARIISSAWRVSPWA